MTSAGVWVVFCILLANFSEVFSQTPIRRNENVDRRSPMSQPTPTCSAKEWRCNNGQCIRYNDLCDGETNCEDKSDETFAACSTKQCPSYLFRCAYGACADGDAKCDGKTDCADNSDELHKDCYTSVTENTCGKLKYQCKNDECINRNQACDGRLDCWDGSDETVTECSELKCSDLTFKCAYGACVDGDSMCNGKDDCFDGSDEIPELCENKKDESADDIRCNVPEHDGCKTRIIGVADLPERVKPFSMLHHTCLGENQCQYCGPEGRLTPLMACPTVCYTLSEKTNGTRCVRDGVDVDCDTPMLAGSKMDVYRGDRFHMSVYCSNNVWNEIRAQHKYRRETKNH